MNIFKCLWQTNGNEDAIPIFYRGSLGTIQQDLLDNLGELQFVPVRLGSPGIHRLVLMRSNAFVIDVKLD